MAESKSLKTAVKSEVKEAQTDAKTGDVKTVSESKGGPAAGSDKFLDQPTGARSRR